MFAFLIFSEELEFEEFEFKINLFHQASVLNKKLQIISMHLNEQKTSQQCVCSHYIVTFPQNVPICDYL